MSLESRSNSALMKRAEQLKRWQDSETFREPNEPKRKSRRIGFSDGCVFLAACAAGDREEVKLLLGRGADIDTANVDGLTALHQVNLNKVTSWGNKAIDILGLTSQYITVKNLTFKVLVAVKVDKHTKVVKDLRLDNCWS